MGRVTFSQKLRLLKGLLTHEIAYTGPLFVSMDLTRRCNLRCLGCRFHSPEAHLPSPGDKTVTDISFDLVRNLIEELGSMDTQDITLLGEGEPFLYPHLFDVIALAKEAGMHVVLFTNGTLLSTDSALALIECRLDVLKVSLWASSPEEYERNYPGSNQDNFGKTIDGVRLLAHLKAETGSKSPTIVLQEPIDRHNFQSLDEMAELAHGMGCEMLSFSPFVTWRGELAEEALSPVQESDLRSSLTRLKKKLGQLSLAHNIDQTLLRYEIGEAVWEKLPCYAGWVVARIKPDGMVLPCGRCAISLGNLNESSLREIWNGPAYRAFRRRASTREGLASTLGDCHCEFCCDIVHSHSIYQYYKWIAPVASWLNAK